jgi:hypothetical protein
MLEIRYSDGDDYRPSSVRMVCLPNLWINWCCALDYDDGFNKERFLQATKIQESHLVSKLPIFAAAAGPRSHSARTNTHDFIVSASAA